MDLPNPHATTIVKKDRHTKILVISLIIMFLLLVCVSAVAIVAVLNYKNLQTNTQDQKMSCEYNGKKYSNKDSFDSTDGCNTCTCGVDGQVSCTEMACSGENPEPTPTAPNPAAGIEETLIGKLQVTDSDYYYGTTKYPAAIMNMKAADLVAMTCYDDYTTFSGSVLANDDGATITDSTINAFVAAQANTRLVQAINWCKTDSGRYIVMYMNCSTSCGGGIGSNFYFGELKNNVLVKETLIPNQLGAYPTCNKSIALTKNDEFYVKCIGGEVVSEAAIYKVFLTQGNYTEFNRVSF